MNINISTKSEYKLKALIYLAAANERGAISAREIAEMWSEYLEQIRKGLKETGKHHAALLRVLDRTTLPDFCTQAGRQPVVSLKSSSSHL